MILCGTGKNEGDAFVGPTFPQNTLAHVKIVLTKSYTGTLTLCILKDSSFWFDF